MNGWSFGFGIGGAISQSVLARFNLHFGNFGGPLERTLDLTAPGY